MNLSSVLVGLALVGFFGHSHIKGKVEGGRYISPNHEFSVAISQNDWPKEKEFPGHVFVDFFLEGDEAAFATLGMRYIEWVSLQQPMSPDRFAQVASSLAAEHVHKHFAPDGKFDIKSSKLAQGTENPTFIFVAAGSIRGNPSYWQGAVVSLGGRVAFMGSLTPESAIGAKPISSVEQLSPYFTGWVQSLHSEQKP